MAEYKRKILFLNIVRYILPMQNYIWQNTFHDICRNYCTMLYHALPYLLVLNYLSVWLPVLNDLLRMLSEIDVSSGLMEATPRHQDRKG
jgi:hypothetical protein